MGTIDNALAPVSCQTQAPLLLITSSTAPAPVTPNCERNPHPKIHKIHSTHHYYIWTIYQRISPVPQNAKQQSPLAGSPTKQGSGIEWKVDMKPLVKQKSSHQLVVYFFGIYPHPSTNRQHTYIKWEDPHFGFTFLMSITGD